VQGRKASRRGGEHDEGDAVVIARVALRDPGLPRLTEQHLDAAKQLVVRGRVAEPVRARLATAAITRLHELERQAHQLEKEMGSRSDAAMLAPNVLAARNASAFDQRGLDRPHASTTPPGSEPPATVAQSPLGVIQRSATVG
jgi:hypothetical protein